MTIEELYQIYLQYPSVQADTRKLQQGDLFFALKGPNFNGNEFAAQALENGAAYAVIDEEQYAVEGKTILVDDVLNTLQQLAKHHRQQFSIPFIAITGSDGKTTTKELIHAVLCTTYTTYTTEGNLNNHIGVPLTILKIKKDAQMAVVEMGANHRNEIASYCTIALPSHGIITNCGKAHLEGFGGEEGVRKGKGELFDHLRQYGGTAFVMWDYDYLQQMSSGIPFIYKYGTYNADVEGITLQSDPFLKVQFNKGMKATVDTQLVGSYNLPNVLAAAAVGLYFNVPEEKITTAITNYTPSNSRSQLLQKGDNKIILDAYNANPTSMKLAIENFARLPENNKTLILGAMAELGVDSIKEHEAIVTQIQQYPWRQVLLVGGDFLKLQPSFPTFPSTTEAGNWLQQQQVHDSYVLIKGSRSMQMEKILNYL
ncbi:MAG: UDP-N-acetylmuramoyl-tripeptide--D-alanyl-D-alanine ligase [Bacteroidota bacterium]|nr:UDP-N-acetylmuramoyl-tripeptide--D-alanyl-D-alanine ligase [Bacteroidota bacterium]